MSKEVDLTAVSERDYQRALDCSCLLLPQQHMPGCPVREGGSSTCVAPAVCCVFDGWEPVDVRDGEAWVVRAALAPRPGHVGYT